MSSFVCTTCQKIRNGKPLIYLSKCCNLPYCSDCVKTFKRNNSYIKYFELNCYNSYEFKYLDCNSCKKILLLSEKDYHYQLCYNCFDRFDDFEIITCKNHHKVQLCDNCAESYDCKLCKVDPEVFTCDVCNKSAGPKETSVKCLSCETFLCLSCLLPHLIGCKQ